MAPVTITATQKAVGQATLAAYKDMQKNGATDNPSYGADDVIVSDVHTQQCSQSTPLTPLFLPVDTDPTKTMDQKIFEQLGDNAQLAIYMAIAKLLYPTGGPGITTDATRTTTTRAHYGSTTTMGATSITITDTGNLTHSTGPTVSGVPVDSVAEATYVEIMSAATGGPLAVNSGPNTGQRIFGRTRVGGSTSPDSVEVELVSRPAGAAPGTSVSSYTWESGQPTTLNLFYGFRQTLNQLDDTAFRRVFR